MSVVLAFLALFGAPALSQSVEPRPCAKPAASLALTVFVQEFNSGDLEGLDRIFAQGTEFQWYSSERPGRRVGASAYSRSTLRAYFARRHAQRDRISTLRFGYSGISGGYGHFSFRLKRSAKDFRRGRPFTLHGKGAVSCASGRIAVLSLSGPER